MFAMTEYQETVTLWTFVGILMFICMICGMKIGDHLKETSLTIGAELGPGPLPRKINGKFYYLIPEKEWLRVQRKLLEDFHKPRIAYPDEDECQCM
jgi:hypothetical protein